MRSYALLLLWNFTTPSRISSNGSSIERASAFGASPWEGGATIWYNTGPRTVWNIEGVLSMSTGRSVKKSHDRWHTGRTRICRHQRSTWSYGYPSTLYVSSETIRAILFFFHLCYFYVLAVLDVVKNICVEVKNVLLPEFCDVLELLTYI